MAQLFLSMEPGIFTLIDAVLDGGKLATDEDFIKINSNANFGMVRKECLLMGYYNSASVPPQPISPVDAASIDPVEIIMIPIFATEAAAASDFIPGQVAFPHTQPFTHGRPLVVPYQHYFDQPSGEIIESIYAFDSPGLNAQVFDWGVSLVFAIAQRLGVFIQGAVQGAVSASSAGSGTTATGIAPGNMQ